MNLLRRLDRFASRRPALSIWIGIALFLVLLGIVGHFDAEDELRAAQPVVFRSV
ncbi:hypothetical protein [Pandoraea pnomenusa]|uniref:hypothetical protein n=1 Tax=Pandoraea pnomenusa TaxID=93220 RepID=UPI00174DC12A|nr:hypothetical protein [Pandoraea pnomenusa]